MGRPPSDRSKIALFEPVKPFSTLRRVLGPFCELLSNIIPTGDNSRFLFPVTFPFPALAVAVVGAVVVDSEFSRIGPSSRRSPVGVSALATTGSGVTLEAAADRRSKLEVSISSDDSGVSVISWALLLGEEDVRRAAICASPLIAERTADPPHLKQSTGWLFRSRVLYRSRSSNNSCLLEEGKRAVWSVCGT